MMKYRSDFECLENPLKNTNQEHEIIWFILEENLSAVWRSRGAIEEMRGEVMAVGTKQEGAVPTRNAIWALF